MLFIQLVGFDDVHFPTGSPEIQHADTQRQGLFSPRLGYQTNHQQQTDQAAEPAPPARSFNRVNCNIHNWFIPWFIVIDAYS